MAQRHHNGTAALTPGVNAIASRRQVKRPRVPGSILVPDVAVGWMINACTWAGPKHFMQGLRKNLVWPQPGEKSVRVV